MAPVTFSYSNCNKFSFRLLGRRLSTGRAHANTTEQVKTQNVLLIYFVVRTVCGKRHKTVECPSLHLSVCPINGQWQQRIAGLLVKSGAGCRCRSTDADAARRASRVNFGPTVRRSKRMLGLRIAEAVTKRCQSEIVVNLIH